MIDYHLFAERGEHLLFFPRSARLYELSEDAALLLEELAREAAFRGEASPLAVPAPPADHPRARLHGRLRDLFHAELDVAPPSRVTEPAGGSNSYQAFSIYLAQSCNLSCRYCWNRGGSFGRPGRLMGLEQAGKVTGLILSLASESKAEQIFVNFYGGEPLLNVAALKKITLKLLDHESRLGKSFRFTVDTNGTLLGGETARFLARHFSQVGVSLDGRREVHDLQRPGKRGEVTWRQIVENVQNFPDRNLLALRATLTRDSDSYLKTFRELATLGIRRIQLEYCHEPGHHGDQAYAELLVPQERQLAELREFVDHYVAALSACPQGTQAPFVANIMDSINRIRRGNRFTRPCGAGMNNLAITSSGEVYPCIAFAARDDFSMGRADAGGCLSLHHTLADFQVDAQLPCHSCWLRYDCAGGCYATHYEMSGHTCHPHPEYCSGMRARSEVYLYALAQLLKRCPWHLEGADAGQRCG